MLSINLIKSFYWFKLLDSKLYLVLYSIDKVVDDFCRCLDLSTNHPLVLSSMINLSSSVKFDVLIPLGLENQESLEETINFVVSNTSCNVVVTFPFNPSTLEKDYQHDLPRYLACEVLKEKYSNRITFTGFPMCWCKGVQPSTTKLEMQYKPPQCRSCKFYHNAGCKGFGNSYQSLNVTYDVRPIA